MTYEESGIVFNEDIVEDKLFKTDNEENDIYTMKYYWRTMKLDLNLTLISDGINGGAFFTKMRRDRR